MLKYPNMREELVGHLRDLADRRRLVAVTDRGSLLDFAIHFLFDDTPLGEDPRRVVGWFLFDEREAQAIEYVCAALNQVLEHYGTEQTDHFYIDCPEWEAAETAARKALRALSRAGSP